MRAGRSGMVLHYKPSVKASKVFWKFWGHFQLRSVTLQSENARAVLRPPPQSLSSHISDAIPPVPRSLFA